MRASRARPCLVGQATQRVDRGHDDSLPVGVAEVEQDAEVAALDALDDLGGRLVPALGRRRVTREKSEPRRLPERDEPSGVVGAEPVQHGVEVDGDLVDLVGLVVRLGRDHEESTLVSDRSPGLGHGLLDARDSWNTHTATMFVTDTVAIGSAVTSPSAFRAPSLPSAMANIFGERSTPTTA